MAVLPRLTPEEAQHRLAALLSRLEGTEAAVALQEARHLIADLTDSIPAWQEAHHRQIQLLNEQHEVFRAAFGVAREPIIMMGPEGEVVFWSPGAEAMFGWSAEEVVGRPLHRLLAPGEFRTAYEQGVKAFRETGEGPAAGRILELDAVHKDGHEFAVELSLSSLRQGSRWFALGVIRDMRERRRAEAALRESEGRFRAVLETLPIGLWLADKSGNLIFGNKAGQEIWGADPRVGPEEYGIFKAWRLPDREPIRPDDWALLQAVQSGRITAGELLEIEDFGGRRKLIRNWASPIRDAGGNITGAFVINQDVTDQAAAELSLQEREAAYRALFEQSPFPIAVSRPSGEYLDVNRRFCELLGMPREEVIGKSSVDLALMDSQVRLAMTRVLEREGRLVDYEVEVTLPSGERRSCQASVAVIEIKGAPAILSVVNDITDRQRAEQELVKTRALLQAAVAQSPSGILIADAPDVTIRYANEAALRIRGDADQPLIGLSVDRHSAAWNVFLTDGITPCPAEDLPLSRAILKGETSQNAELIVRRSSGEDRWVSANASPVKDADGRVVGGLVIYHDVTEDRLAEDALRKSETTLRGLFRAVPVGLVILKDRVIFTANDRLAEMFGYGPGELIGQPTRVLYPSDEGYRRAGQTLYEIPGERGTTFAESRMVRKDGSVREVSLNATPLDPDDPSAGIAVTLLDITERKRAAAERERLQAELLQSQKMEMVGRLAGGIAHDLNNLLTPILGYAELALMKLGPADAKRLGVQEIEEAAKRARDLTHQLLAFSRKQPMELGSVNLTEMVAQFEKILQRTIREDIRLTSRLAPALGAVRADRAQLQQVLLNLVVNANDAMPSGGTLDITTEEVVCSAADMAGLAEVAPGAYVRLTVQDTGCGMDAEVRQHIFEPFYTTKPEGKGTGLGLATCYGIVRQHGGFFRVETTPGRGSRFAVYLPRAAREPSTVAPTDPGRVTAGRETILFIDDARTVRMLLQNILQSLGYGAIEAATPEAALQMAREHAGPIHLLITDVIMPGMNGRQLYAAVRRVRPEIKALYISGYTDDIIAPQGVLETGIHFLAKPFTLAGLSEKIREALGGTSLSL